MLSRVADSLYWMSRYLERAEHTARLLDVNLNLMLDESSTSSEHRWQRVLHALGSPRDVEWNGDPYALTRTLSHDLDHKASIVNCIIAARENSRHVREQISTEQWQRLNSLYLQVTRPHIEAEIESAEFLQLVMDSIHQFQGITDSTMSHGEGWQFIQVGTVHRTCFSHRDTAGGVSRRPLGPPGAHTRGQRISGVDGPASFCHRIRGVLQGLHRRPDSRSSSRISSARPAVSSFAPLRDR